MKKLYLWLLILASFYSTPGNAQYVVIPDPNFVIWLQSNGYSGCMNGNQLDTTCHAVIAATSVTCSNNSVVNLSGIQYFKALRTLDCSYDSLITLPPLPSLLTTLICSNNFLSGLTVLPTHVTALNCGYNNITVINALPASLQQLSCTNNAIKKLPAVLPGGLQNLSCDFNKLDSLPSLPASLTNLSCAYNPLHRLPTLPSGLQNLTCYSDSLSVLDSLPAGLLSLNCNINQLSALPALPGLLTSLQCANNNLTALPALPATLQGLYCLKNHLDSLPPLPAALTLLNCNSNLLGNLPGLPAALQTLECAFNHITLLPPLGPHVQTLDCSYNQLTALPALPSTVYSLSCNDNHLVALPDLPASLRAFNCGFNQLTFIPNLPDSLNTLYLTYNLNLTCLPELKRIVTFDFSYTSVACLPDYGNITNSNPAVDTFPLCGFFNPYGCPVFKKINGLCFVDGNNNCRFDSLDVATNYVKVQLYSGGILQQQVYTSGEGQYTFDSTAFGNYELKPDTTNLPFKLSCPDTGYLGVTLSAGDSVSYNNNFAFRCPLAGFDIGVQSILNDYHTPRTGSTFSLRAIAGDLSQLYGAGCASGVAGEVHLIFSGPVHYLDTATGALPPTSVNGDTLSWNIADFGAINSYSSFNLWFKIDSTAKADTVLCFNVSVTPTNGDVDSANNHLSYCIRVIDSLNGNEKEVYPLNSLDTSKPWLTYTIRFQNQDTLIARNIIITDTLDSHLDPSTFQLLAYSAKNVTQIFGNVVTFNFPNINLPDSLTSDSASRGYIQYKIKMLDSLPQGTQFYNTAYIQFDTSAIVMTNTTLDSLVADTVKPIINTGVFNLPETTFIALYPNPARGYTFVNVSENLVGNWLELSDGIGRVIVRQPINSSRYLLQTGSLAKGVYLVRISGTGGMVKKLVVQ